VLRSASHLPALAQRSTRNWNWLSGGRGLCEFSFFTCELKTWLVAATTRTSTIICDYPEAVNRERRREHQQLT